ncbi:hypothetical protein [Nonomuraea sp. NPDC049480]|uniref:hypothetical protein n=1 Tax=Nonomuraea sp. NPDC049480 TaxID=3364353 RepID=UPI0037BA7F69
MLTFGPDGITGHLDHQTVSAWTTAAFELSAPPGARLLHATVAERRASRWSELSKSLGIYASGYPITTPAHRLAVDLVLDTETAARKVRALTAQETQTGVLITAMGMDRYTAWVGDEAFTEWSRRPAAIMIG